MQIKMVAYGTRGVVVGGSRPSAAPAGLFISFWWLDGNATEA